MSSEVPRSLFPARDRDFGRVVAKLLCALFALLGALPLGAGSIARSEAAQRWASAETSRELTRLLGIEATYRVRLSLLPLRLELLDLEVASNDGQGAAVTATRAAITPRIFSLIAGRLDIGDVELEGAEHRLVFERGKIQNLDLRLPDASSESNVGQAPFSSLAVTDATFDLEVDGIKIRTGTVDLDVFADKQNAFEVAVRAGESAIVYPPGYFSDGQTLPPQEAGSAKPASLASWDSDVVCQLDARLHVEAGSILVRRLSLLGTADIDPSPGSAPSCRTESKQGDVAGRVGVSLSQFRLAPGSAKTPWFFQGNVVLRAPVDLGNRFASGGYRGWVGLTGDVRYDGSSILPHFRGKLRTSELWLGKVRLLMGAEGHVEVANDIVHVPQIDVDYGGGKVTAHDTRVAPFENNVPFSTRRVDISKVGFPAMLRDIDITPNTIVRWLLDKVSVSDFKGQLIPPKLDGDLNAETTDFQITDKAYHSPGRRQMFAVKSRASLIGRFGLRSEGIQFNDVLVRFGKSQLKTTVHIGFDNSINLVIPESRLDLSDISPIVTVEMAGTAELTAEMKGQMGDPTLTGTLAVENWVFGGFPVGSLEKTNILFRPLWVEAEGSTLVKGGSRFDIPHAKVDFGTEASIVADATVNTQAAEVKDFLHMWHFDQDPLWRELSGKARTSARVHYALGGPQDTCKSGNLRVKGAAEINRLSLFDERYDTAESTFDFKWTDIDAGYHGMAVTMPGYHLRKGRGSLLGSMQITHGAQIQGDIVATGIPLSKIDSMGQLGKILLGDVTATGQVSGSLDNLKADVQANVSPVVMGRSMLESSTLTVKLEPRPSRVRFSGKRSGCNRLIPDPNNSLDDVALGDFRISGHLFGEQVTFDDFSLSRQKHKIAQGGVILKGLSLAPLLELRPEIALTKQRPKGQLSGRIDLERLPLDNMGAATGRARLDDLWLDWQGYRFRVPPTDAIALSQGKLEVPKLTLSAATPAGHTTTFDVGGSISRMGSDPELDLELNLRPVELATWAAVIPRAERVSGSLRGNVHLSGPIAKPKQRGGFKLRKGELSVRGRELAFDAVNVDIELEDNALRVSHATANFNGGELTAKGSAPLNGLQLGRYRGVLQAKSVNIPTSAGVKLNVDANLETEWRPSKEGESPVLPKIGGEVSIRSFEYSRAVTMNADIGELAKRGNRTEFESYDPNKDAFELDMLVTSQVPLRLTNNLIDASLAVAEPGLRLTGTNQRFGLRGRLKVIPGGHIRLRRNNFEVQSGEIHFDDPTQIAPRVDVTAVTDYKRYSGSTAASDPTAAGTPGGAPASGDWRVNLRAYGDAENLRIDLTSQPKLSQDDIFLLLTVGLTRAELDQAQSASLGESVALEALGSLTGADTAVTDALPVIDEFRFGSSYSSRTGRTEPTVTIGKRLTERIRAFVTSGLSESREVRSNLEWRLNRKLSVEGSYDNVNDISSAGLGNLGADVRWRLEFE